MKTLHTFIICWPGKEEYAEQISSHLVGGVDPVTVIYSTSDESVRNGSGTWVQVPNAWFYGRKFRRAAELSSADITLIIHADVSCTDWKRIVDRCKEIHEIVPSLGVWSPEVNFTPWDTPSVEISRDPENQLSFVTQTDGIVWSVSKPVLERLKELEYEENNLGWGIDWAAISFAYANNLLVARDLSVEVVHPRSTGYGYGDACGQMDRFLAQLSRQEQVACKLLSDFVAHKRAAQRS